MNMFAVTNSATGNAAAANYLLMEDSLRSRPYSIKDIEILWNINIDYYLYNIHSLIYSISPKSVNMKTKINN